MRGGVLMGRAGRRRWLTGLLALLANTRAARAPECLVGGVPLSVEQINGLLAAEVTPPKHKARYDDKMARYPGGVEIVEARAYRRETRQAYSPRQTYSTMADMLAQAATVEIPARACGLQYGACDSGSDWGCAGVLPVNGSTSGGCTADNFERYSYSVIIPAVPFIAFGAVVVVVGPLWYLLRCFGCCGGRKPGKTKKLCLRNDTKVEPDNMPSYTDPQRAHSTNKRKLTQLNFFRGLATFLLLLCLSSSGSGYNGNSGVDAGLTGVVDVAIFELRGLIRRAARILEEMNEISANTTTTTSGGGGSEAAAMSEEQLCSLASLDAVVAGLESDIAGIKESGLQMRLTLVHALFLAPLAVVNSSLSSRR